MFSASHWRLVKLYRAAVGRPRGAAPPKPTPVTVQPDAASDGLAWRRPVDDRLVLSIRSGGMLVYSSPPIQVAPGDVVCLDCVEGRLQLRLK